MAPGNRVSIRARPGGRAMPPAMAATPPTTRFQSAPGREAGRCDYPRDPNGMLPLVSIRARPGGRAMRAGRRSAWLRIRSFNPRPAGRPGDAPAPSRTASTTSSFNPRPAGRPGDASKDSVTKKKEEVSIRARPGGRAMHLLERDFSRPDTFQSAPGREAGRCGAPRSWPNTPSCFNPRPAGRPGDAPRT